MKVISLNIECNKHYDLIFPFFEKEQPDVICLQEVLEEDFVMLKTKLGMEGYFKPFTYYSSTHEQYRSVYGKRHGVAIFAKSFTDHGSFYYWGEEHFSMMPFAEYQLDIEKYKSYVLVWADAVSITGETIRFVTTHFPVTVEGESSPHQLEILPPFFKYLSGLGELVLCGDFNAPRGNETFTRISKNYKDTIPHTYTTSLDQVIHRVPDLKEFMVDGLFTSPAIIATEVALCDGVSDHKAVVATVSFLS